MMEIIKTGNKARVSWLHVWVQDTYHQSLELAQCWEVAAFAQFELTWAGILLMLFIL